MGKCNCNIPKHLIIIDDSYTLQAFERFKRFPSISTNWRAEYKSKVRKLSKWRLILRFARSIVRGCSWKRAMCLNIELKIDTSDTYLACPDEGCIRGGSSSILYDSLCLYVGMSESIFPSPNHTRLKSLGHARRPAGRGGTSADGPNDWWLHRENCTQVAQWREKVESRCRLKCWAGGVICMVWNGTLLLGFGWRKDGICAWISCCQFTVPMELKDSNINRSSLSHFIYRRAVMKFRRRGWNFIIIDGKKRSDGMYSAVRD